MSDVWRDPLPPRRERGPAHGERGLHEVLSKGGRQGKDLQVEKLMLMLTKDEGFSFSSGQY